MKLRWNGNRGSALIELALSMPLFLLLIMGTFELGRVAYFAIEVKNAARAGASFGAVNRGNATLTDTIRYAAANDAPDLPNLQTTPGTTCVCETVTTSGGTVTQSYNPSSGTVSCSNFTGINAGACSTNTATQLQIVVYYVTVSTRVDLDPLVHLPGLPKIFSLNGYCQMRVLPN